ncbi:MAG TPA: hypothetical protein VG939_03845 [Caulobacteraceae bacterium]|nr:hypothetical protein [Caulobacteraceae bacterium]
MTRLPAIAACCSLLAACATAPPAHVELRTVQVPTPVPCRPAVGPEPAYPDSDEALRQAPDLFARVKLIAAGRLMRIAREAELKAALAACEAGG